MTVPHIMRMGGEEYAKIGAENSTGTKLVSVSGNVQRPGQLRDRARHALARDHLRPRRRPAGRARGQVLVPRRLVSSPVLTEGRPRPPLRLRLDGEGRLDARLRRDHRRRRLRVRSSTSRCKTAQFYAHESCGKCTPCREGTSWTVKMLERIKAGLATPDGPRHHGLGPGADHRQLPVRARRRDGDADRLDGREVPRRVRGVHRGGARSATRTATRRPSVEPVARPGAAA